MYISNLLDVCRNGYRLPHLCPGVLLEVRPTGDQGQGEAQAGGEAYQQAFYYSVKGTMS